MVAEVIGQVDAESRQTYGARGVPCKLVDELWHAHILDTRAYRDDCYRIFGFFYDHYPYFGLRDAADAAPTFVGPTTGLSLCMTPTSVNHLPRRGAPSRAPSAAPAASQ